MSTATTTLDTRPDTGTALAAVPDVVRLHLREDGGHWIWTGMFNRDGTPRGKAPFPLVPGKADGERPIRRSLWELLRGPVTAGHDLVPQCDAGRRCVRPDCAQEERSSQHRKRNIRRARERDAFTSSVAPNPTPAPRPRRRPAPAKPKEVTEEMERMTMQDWRADAACSGAPTALFFPVGPGDPTAALGLAYCAGCPVIEQCRADAAPYGTQGGRTEWERRADRDAELLARFAARRAS